MLSSGDPVARPRLVGADVDLPSTMGSPQSRLQSLKESDGPTDLHHDGCGACRGGAGVRLANAEQKAIAKTQQCPAQRWEGKDEREWRQQEQTQRRSNSSQNQMSDLRVLSMLEEITGSAATNVSILPNESSHCVARVIGNFNLTGQKDRKSGGPQPGIQLNVLNVRK